MKRKIVFITIFFIVLIVGLVFIKLDYKEESRACFENNCFFIELAETSKERSRGLMFREQLDSNKGMLFIFGKEGIYHFWMKNTLIPLDIIWINENNEVVFISENTQPCNDSFCFNINPGNNAKYVLEINGGISEMIGLTKGDKISLDIKE